MSGLERLADEISALLEPLTDAVENPGALMRIYAALGVRETDSPAMLSAAAAVADFVRQAETLAGESDPSFDSILSLLDQARGAFSAISVLTDAGGPVPDITNLGEDLAELLVVIWLAKRFPVARNLAYLLGVLRPAWEQPVPFAGARDGKVVRDPFRIDRFNGGRIVELVKDPLGALRADYANALATDADAAAVADRLFPRLQLLLSSLGVTSRYGINSLDAAELGPWAAPMAHTLVIFIDRALAGGAADIGVVVNLSPASQGDLGLVVSPFGGLDITRKAGRWALEMKATAGMDAVAWGRHGVTLLASAAAIEFSGGVTATLAPPESGPAQVFGAPKSTRLEIGGLKLSAQTRLSAARKSLALAADVTKSRLVIASGDGDGFVSSLMPADGLQVDFDLGLAWSTDKGLTLRGSAGLEATIPVGRSVAGVTLTTVNIAIRVIDGHVDTELSGSFSAAVGPVRAAVERVGLAARLTFPDRGGNLGVADIDLGFKPPSGAGLSIDAHGVLTGGGFLSLDPDSGNYGGVVQLSLHDKISLTGYGLIATKMPDGGPGFSLLVFITAEGFQPIPLGFGLMLESIGGMLGIHRTFDKEVLRAGLKSDTLALLLFPRDPIGNAPALLTALAAAFPIRRGSYLVGLLARITWFTPTLITLDLALILELGARTRLLVLGRVSALLPSRENDLIRINLDSIGVLDFDEGSFEADAVLVDSRIARQFPVTGSAALRARWPSAGAEATFVMAVGGFNPRFAPPAGFPALDRVTIALCSGANPRLICESYFAITANTVQFGARASLYAEALGFSVTGDLGFDALVTLVPPHFLVDFHASVQLKRGSCNLFKVTLDGTLEGPLPLRLAARATIEILWFSVSVHFDYTLVGGDALPAVPSIRLEDEVKKALADPASWTTRSDLGHGVALRALPAATTPVLDPLGRLVVQQQVAPLNTKRTVDTYGGVRVAGPQLFKLTGAFDGQAGAAVSAAFAPARYFGMTDDEKLAAPSFESHDAGVVLGADKVIFDAATIGAASLGYDEFVLNPVAPGAPPPPPPKPVAYQLPAVSLAVQAVTGAAARAPARQAGRQRFRNPDAEPAATLNTMRWQVAQAYGETKAPAQPPTTWSEGRAALTAMKAGDRWVLCQTHELQA